jgi:hypothetical protein
MMDEGLVIKLRADGLDMPPSVRRLAALPDITKAARIGNDRGL